MRMYMRDFIMVAEGNRVTALHNTNALRKHTEVLIFLEN